MAGGAHRGPVGLGRQRRTLRLMQLLLVVAAVGIFIFAGYSWGRAAGFDEGRKADTIDEPKPPGAAQAIVLVVLGAGGLVGAWLLGGPGAVRIPTPAQLQGPAGREGIDSEA
jgi:hypothetical protein